MAENAGTGQQTTLRDFLNVVFRRKFLVLTIVGFVTVTVFYLNTRKPLIYESSSRILVRRGEQSDALSGSIRYLGWAEEVSSQIQVILSEDVFNAASQLFADSVAAKGLPAKWKFQPGSVRADVVGESNAFMISYVNVNPDVCRLGCEVMTLAFQNYYRKRKTPPALSDFFAQQISDARAELEEWHQKRNDFLNREQFYGASETSRVLMSKMDALEGKLLEMDQKLRGQRMRVETLKVLSSRSGEELEKELAFSASPEGVLTSAIVQNIKFQLLNLRMKQEDLLQKYTERHPDVIALNQQIQDLHEDLKRQMENAYRMEEKNLAELVTNRAPVAQELLETRTEWEAIPDRDRQLTEIDDHIKRVEKELELLLGKQSDVAIAKAGRTDWEVTILSHAGRPIARRTRDYVRMAVGPMLALVVALGIAFFMESLDHSLKNMAEVEEYLDTKVLATISEFRR
jgi:succinoglycan biosynthesis transport protein ExoP